MPWTQNVLEKRVIPLSVIDIVADQDGDPSSYANSVAFVPAGTLPPGNNGWTTGTWVQDPVSGLWYATVLVGPNDSNSPIVDVTLDIGTYAAYVQVNTGSELWVNFVDVITITDGNPVIPVATTNDLIAYMGYPFNPEQIQAAQQVLDALTAELSTLLKADLSVQQYTETCTIPGGMTLWNNSYFGTNVADQFYPDQLDGLPYGLLISPVLLQHYPIVSWDALSIQVPAQEGQPFTTTSASIAWDIPLSAIYVQPVGASIAAGTPLTVNDYNAPYGLGNTINVVTNAIITPGASVIPINTVVAIAPLVAGAKVMISNAMTWVTIPVPTYPDSLPEFTPGQTVMVTYTAGWNATQMPDVKQTILRAAARELTNRLDTAVGLKGNLNVVNLPDGSPGQTGSPGFLPSEIAPLRRYKHRVII